MKRHAICLLLFLFFSLPPRGLTALAQSMPGACDEQLELSRMVPTMIGKRGRLQDYASLPTVSPTVTRILHLGKKAVPLLIACLTDETTTKLPVFNFWPRTTVGDIAFAFLSDLFLDPSGQHATLNGVITYREVISESPARTFYFVAWSNYIAKHGRRHLQEVWSREWAAHQNDVYWDKSERCFKVRKKLQ